MTQPGPRVRWWSIFVLIALVAAAFMVVALVRMMTTSTRQVIPPLTRPSYGGW